MKHLLTYPSALINLIALLDYLSAQSCSVV